MSERQITNRIRKLQELETQKENLENQIAEVKGQIQAEMKEAEELKAGNFIVRWVNVVTQRIDTKALKAAYPYICDDYCKPTQSRRFSIAEAK